MKRILPLVGVALVGACATPPPPAPPPHAAEFQAEAFAWSTVPGPNTVAGAVVLTTPAKGAYTCAGRRVGLIPDSPYSTRRMAYLYGSPARAVLPESVVRSRTLADPGTDYRRFSRSATCDPQGRFIFSNLPDGSWFVIAPAAPTAGGSPEDTLVLMQRVQARGGQAISLNLS